MDFLKLKLKKATLSRGFVLLAATLGFLFVGIAHLTLYPAGKAHAFAGAQIAQCSDTTNPNDPDRIVNTVSADTTKPEFMLLKFDSQQNAKPYSGIVTVNWKNLSNGTTGQFQMNKQDTAPYKIAAVSSGSGLVSLQINFNNTITGADPKILPTAQCNATVYVISKGLNTNTNPPAVTPPPAVTKSTIPPAKTYR